MGSGFVYCGGSTGGSGSRNVDLLGRAAKVYFSPSFLFRLVGGGSFLRAFSKSPSAASDCWMRRWLYFSYSSPASSTAI